MNTRARTERLHDSQEPGAVILMATDLSDDTILAALAALERNGVQGIAGDLSDRCLRLLDAGMALAAEAWRRGLITVAVADTEARAGAGGQDR